VLQRLSKPFDAATLEPNRPECNPDSLSTSALVLLERIHHLMASPPPADWDGVFVIRSK
jgi:hypothetical protein